LRIFSHSPSSSGRAQCNDLRPAKIEWAWLESYHAADILAFLETIGALAKRNCWAYQLFSSFDTHLRVARTAAAPLVIWQWR
jgi:hypothetical protein